MNIKFFFNNLLTKYLNPKNSKNINYIEKIIIYSNTINVSNSNTEYRQKKIKQLINQSNLIDEEFINNELLDCSSEIDEVNFDGRTRLKVIVLIDEFICDLGYIPREFQDELYEYLNKSDSYTTNLYVTKEKNTYFLKLEITFYKEITKKLNKNNEKEDK